MTSCASIESIRNVSGGCAVLSALILVGGTRPAPPPLRLAIYYGYPSLVNDVRGDLPRAVSVFADYDVVVLGDGLEFDGDGPPTAAGPKEHAFTKRLIDRLAVLPRRTSVLGYVDLGSTDRLSPDRLVDRIDRWAAMGARGVFLDEAGFDFGVTRERQNLAVKAAHRRGLSACLNAFQPSDVFDSRPSPLTASGGGNPNGIAPVISARDAVLLESFAVRNGVAEAPEAFADRTRAALDGRDRFGTRVFAIATNRDHAPGGPAPYAWWTAAAFGIDAFGWGMPAYSAVTSRLPWISRPPAEASLAGAEFTGPLRVRDGRWVRTTTRGQIVIDGRSLQGSFEPR